MSAAHDERISSDVEMTSSDNESVAAIEGLDDDGAEFFYADDDDDFAAFDDSDVDDVNLDGADSTIDEDDLDAVAHPKKKPWEVDYTSRNEQDITNLQMKEVDQIAAMFNVKVRPHTLLPCPARCPRTDSHALSTGHRCCHSFAPHELEQRTPHRALHGRP